MLSLLVSAIGQQKERMHLVHSDQMQGQVINGRNVRRLIGSVEFRQGELKATCKEAREYPGEGIFEFVGHVLIDDGSKSIAAEHITYFEESDKLFAHTKVVLVDSAQMLLADTLEYWQESEKAFARGNVVMENDSERVVLTGRYAEYWRNDGYALVTGDPVFTRKDSSGTRDLVIAGETIESFEDGERVRVVNNVEIFRGDITALCDTLEYLKSAERVRLARNPIARQLGDRLTGRYIDLYLKDNEVTDIHVLGSAVVSTKVDSAITTDIPFDILTGEEIFVSVSDSKIDTVVIKNRATSYYHVIDDSVEQGINKVLGDEIIMIFKDDEIQQVEVRSSPGTSIGSVYPPNAYNQIENELIALLAKNDILAGAKSDSMNISP